MYVVSTCHYRSEFHRKQVKLRKNAAPDGVRSPLSIVNQLSSNLSYPLD